MSTGGILSHSLQEYVGVREAAAIIGIGYMTLHKRIHRGTVEVHRPSDRVVLIHRGEVQRLKDERKKGSC